MLELRADNCRSAAVVIVTKIHRDPIQPRLWLSIERVEILEQPQEDLLADVLRVFHPPQEPVGSPEDPRPVFGHQTLEVMPPLTWDFADRRQCDLSRVHLVQQ